MAAREATTWGERDKVDESAFTGTIEEKVFLEAESSRGSFHAGEGEVGGPGSVDLVFSLLPFLLPPLAISPRSPAQVQIMTESVEIKFDRTHLVHRFAYICPRSPKVEDGDSVEVL